MSRSTLFVALVLAVVGIGFAAWSSLAQAPKEKGTPGSEPLSSKPVFVMDGEKVAYVLEQPRIRSAGGRSFVVGKSKAGTSLVKDQFAGNTIWIPLDKVTQMIELEKAE
jgi:hypothetical protein